MRRGSARLEIRRVIRQVKRHCCMTGLELGLVCGKGGFFGVLQVAPGQRVQRHPGHKLFERSYLTAVSRSLPALNRATRRALIWIASPVWGLRPTRAFRFVV